MCNVLHAYTHSKGYFQNSHITISIGRGSMGYGLNRPTQSLKAWPGGRNSTTVLYSLQKCSGPPLLFKAMSGHDMLSSRSREYRKCHSEIRLRKKKNAFLLEIANMGLLDDSKSWCDVVVDKGKGLEHFCSVYRAPACATPMKYKNDPSDLHTVCS